MLDHRPVAVALLLLLAGGCPRPAPPAPEAPVEVLTPGIVWLPASCELPEQLARERARLEHLGAVEITGGQPYRWAFACRGLVLEVDVEPVAPTADGDPVLWAGALADPAGVVTIELDAGAGQEALREQLATQTGPAALQIDLATGVVSPRPSGTR